MIKRSIDYICNKFFFLKERICSSLYWAKKGWRIYNWDSEYALEVFRDQCVRVVNEISHPIRGRHHVGWEKDVKRLREFICILNRIIANDYICMLYKDGEHFSFDELPLGDGTAILQFKSPPLKECVIIKEIDAMKYAFEQRRQDWEFVGTYLKKYFDSWWD